MRTATQTLAAAPAKVMGWDANCPSGGKSAYALDELIMVGFLDVASEAYSKRHLHDWAACAQQAGADTDNPDDNAPDSVRDESEE